MFLSLHPAVLNYSFTSASAVLAGAASVATTPVAGAKTVTTLDLKLATNPEQPSIRECSQAEIWSNSQNSSCQSFALAKQILFENDTTLSEVSLGSAISYSAADLGEQLVADLTTVQQPPSATPSTSPSAPPSISPPAQQPSDALNLPVLRSIKKPVGRKVLDTGVGIAGIQPKDTSENFWTRDFLTGNWGGTRDRLLDQGIDFYLVNFSDVYSNVGGGKSQNTAFDNVVLAGLDLYTSQLGWWKNGQVHLTAVDIQGVSVGRDYAGSFNSVDFVDPIEQSTRLFELWYGQKFGRNSQYELRLGKIFPFVRIAASQTAGIFTNTSFQYPTYLGVSPSTGMSVPFASAPLGIQFSYTPSPTWLLIGQIQDGFDDPTGGLNNRSGFNTGLSAEEGIEGITEVVYRPNQERGSTGLPGYYRLGFQFHSGLFKSQSRNTDDRSLALSGGSRKEDWGNYSVYFMADQMIYRESPDSRDRTQGLNLFFKTVVAPKQDINTISWNLATGLAYEGLIPGRNRDVLGLGVSYSRFSDGVRRFDRDRQLINPDTVIRDSETVLELVYVAQITPWWYLIGSFQQIINPSGNSDTPDATVIGISNRLAF
jgi:porin